MAALACSPVLPRPSIRPAGLPAGIHTYKHTRSQVRLLKWLKHPCVLTLFDVFLSADCRLVCLTTTYCESGDLAKIIKHASKTKSLLGEKTVLGWFAQVKGR